MSEWAKSEKSAEAYRTISEVAEELKLPQHVLRFWETRFPQVKPLKRAGGRRFYRPEDLALLRTIKTLLYGQGYTIKGVQRLLREQGPRAVVGASAPASGEPDLLPGPLQHDRGEGQPAGEFRPAGFVDPAPLERASGAVAASADPPFRTRPEPGATLGLIQAVAAELSECRRLIAAVRSGRS